MQEFINQLVQKVGLDEATAEKVVAFVQEHMTDIPGWLDQSGILDKLPGGLGDTIEGMLGGDGQK